VKNKNELIEITRKIMELTGWDEPTLNKKIDELIEQHTMVIDGKKTSWLTREGAATLVFKRVGGIEKREEKNITVEDAIDGYSGVIYTRVLNISEPREVTSKVDNTVHRVVDIILGDATASLPMTLWDDRVDLIEGLKKDDILRLSAARYYKNRLTCSSFERIDEKIAPAIPKADEIPLYPRRFLLSMAEQVGLTSESRATIVGVYKTDYTYSSCATCLATVVSGHCRKCGQEVPRPLKRLRVPVLIDDGSLRVRAVIWDRTIKKLVGKGPELAEICATDPTNAFQMFNMLLLGKDVIVRGTIVLGDFGLEMMVSDAEMVTDLKKEMDFISKTK